MRIRMSNNVSHTAAICLASLFFCALGLAQDVTYNSLPGTNFASFHTYQWANCGNAHPTGMVDAEIKQDMIRYFPRRDLLRSLRKPKLICSFATKWPSSSSSSGTPGHGPWLWRRHGPSHQLNH